MGRKRGTLPHVTVLEISAIDEEGDLQVRPIQWDSDEAPPRIVLQKSKKANLAPGLGDLVLARLSKLSADLYLAEIMRILPRKERQVLGVYSLAADGPRLEATSRKDRDDFRVILGKNEEPQVGAVYWAEFVQQRGRRVGLRPVRLLEKVGDPDDHRVFSLLAIAENDIPTVFSKAALEEAAECGPATMKDRKDLREIDLVTIDGADARDFDDAVFAEADDAHDNPGGWRLLVAIADVSWYVRPESPLDQTAQERGNSVYFPDRVVPMLPEALSNGWCSLVPDEDRPCLVAEMRISPEGDLLQYQFHRAMMRSKRRFTYEEVQAIADDQENNGDPLTDRVAALYGAHQALLKAREARGTLELELPEREVLLSEKGEVEAIQTRQRLDSHRLIEDFMITANVAAAKSLEENAAPCLYRIHEPPDPVKLEALRETLKGSGIKGIPLGRAQVVKPRDFNNLLAAIEGRADKETLHLTILRSLTQALYSPHNKGHFGLALRRYAHFTSPIRRYADLLVHRALVTAHGLGEGGLTADKSGATTWLGEIGSSISQCERRAAAAERQTIDRFAAAYLSNSVGARFEAQIVGVTKAGLFVEMPESGAQGLLPISHLGDDRFILEPGDQALVGRRWGECFRLGETIGVRLLEARPLAGALLFTLAEQSEERAQDTQESRKPSYAGKRKKASPSPKGRRGRGRRR